MHTGGRDGAPYTRRRNDGLSGAHPPVSVTESIARRPARIGLLTLLVLGWSTIASGIATDLALLTISGAAAVAIANVLFAKAVLEIGSSVRSLGKVREQTATTEANLRRALIDIDGLKTRSLDLAGDIATLDGDLAASRGDQAALRASIEAVDRGVGALAEEGRRRHDLSDAGLTDLARDIEEVGGKLKELAASHETTRGALSATRGITDKLAVHVRAQIADHARLLAAASTDVKRPLLSIAIPSFDRPGPLKSLLESVASEVATCPPGLVEVCITDDASSDPEALETALAFAEHHGYASFRTQDANVGIERNVLAAGHACRGEYLLLIGNDDVLLPGSIAAILGDIETTGVPVLLYEKKRINGDGSPRPDVVGSTPIELEEGATHLFSTMIEAAGAQGLLSTFGYVGPIVVRTKPFLAVDPAPYLDLTMYAPTCVMVAAFSREPVLYRNLATILHRTPSQPQKEAEALGRREQEFMAGGAQRTARYFGTTLAAALQRLVDRRALDHEALAEMPENLMSRLPLVEWIARNRALDPTVDQSLDDSVVEDANRFFTAISTHRGR